MTRVALRENVYMAEADGLLVFMDLNADRYFALNSEFSASLSPLIKGQGEGADREAVRRLRQANVIAEEGAKGRVFAKTLAIPPLRELTLPQPSLISGALAMFCRMRAERALNTRHIAEIVRSRRVWRAHASTPQLQEPELIAAAGRFGAGRALRGGRDACLKEALALLYFLGRRGADVNWVFAVKGAPFAAHCWIQVGDLVLNDNVENVRPYTPVMVV